MTAFTPRQLRTMADHVERLTKARIANEDLGVPTTPDTFALRFPDGTLGVCTWTRADLSPAASRRRDDGKPVHRYVLDLGPNQPASQNGDTADKPTPHTAR